MPTPEERASADYAGRVIDSLLPGEEETRRACLNALAESIELAHASGAGKWGVTLNPDVVRLNVGHVVPFDLRRYEIFIGLDGAAFDKLPEGERTRFDELIESLNDAGFSSVKESITFRVAPENLPRVWPIVRDAHASFIERAARGAKQLHPHCRSALSPGILAYLREEMQREIPEPALEGAGSTQPGTAASSVWRDTLAAWLKNNSPTMPDDLRALREAFVGRFPKEKLSEMTLEQYAIGTGRKDTFSYWLEYETKDLGSVGGGDARKTGVWWDKDENRWLWNEKLYRNEEDAIKKIRNGLASLIRAVEEERFEELDQIGKSQVGPVRHLRTKPLYLYFPNQFLPVWQMEHLENFLKLFDVEAEGDVLARNRQLLRVMHEQPEFEGFDTKSMVKFLYDSFPQKKLKGSKVASPEPTPQSVIQPQPSVEEPAALSELMSITRRTRNVLLYGPPGTGKTFIVRRFADHFLRPQVEVASDGTQRRLSVLQDLRWYEAIAIAMSLTHGKEHFSVPELAHDGLIQDYAQLKRASRLTNALWAQLQIHTGPEVETVKYANRSAPFLFRKNENAEWSLSQGGLEYVAANLSEELNQLQTPASSTSMLEDFFEFVTFHQSFAYEELVEGLRPATDEETGNIRYEVRPGVFKKICARAEAAWRGAGCDEGRAPKYLLVIDEINRANIAKVLGELITLLEDDKRLGMPNELTVRLPYSGERFGVPPNLYVLGTMNTADRSIALLDIALRRRFTFVEMPPRPEAIRPRDVAGVNLAALLDGLNARVARLLDRDHRIGHSYLFGLRGEDDLRFAWYHRVVPLLEEYFYNSGERLQAVLGTRFVRTQSDDPAAGESYGEGHALHEIVRLQGPEFLDALNEIASSSAPRARGPQTAAAEPPAEELRDDDTA